MLRELKEELLKQIEEKIEFYSNEIELEKIIEKICAGEDSVLEILNLNEEEKLALYKKTGLSDEDVKIFEERLNFINKKDTISGEIGKKLIKESYEYIENVVKDIKEKYSEKLKSLEDYLNLLEKLKMVKKDILEDFFTNFSTLDDNNKILSCLQLSDEQKKEVIKYIVINKANKIIVHSTDTKSKKVEKVETRIEDIFPSFEVENNSDEPDKIDEYDMEEEIEELGNLDEQTNDELLIKQPSILSLDEIILSENCVLIEKVINSLKKFWDQNNADLLKQIEVIKDDVLNELRHFEFSDIYSSYVGLCETQYDNEIKENNQSSDVFNEEIFDSIINKIYDENKKAVFNTERDFQEFILKYIIKIFDNIDIIFEAYGENDDLSVAETMIINELNKICALYKHKQAIYALSEKNNDFSDTIAKMDDEVKLLFLPIENGETSFQKSYDELDVAKQREFITLLTNALHTRRLREDQSFSFSKVLKYDSQNSVMVIFRKVGNDYLILDVVLANNFSKNKLANRLKKFESAEVENTVYKILHDEEFYDSIIEISQKQIEQILGRRYGG